MLWKRRDKSAERKKKDVKLDVGWTLDLVDSSTSRVAWAIEWHCLNKRTSSVAKSNFIYLFITLLFFNFSF